MQLPCFPISTCLLSTKSVARSHSPATRRARIARSRPPRPETNHLVNHPNVKVPENIYKPYVVPWGEVCLGLGMFDTWVRQPQLYAALVGDFPRLTGGLVCDLLAWRSNLCGLRSAMPSPPTLARSWPQAHAWRVWTGSALMEHCMLTRAGVRYRSGREIKLEIPASFFPTAGQQGLVMLTFA